MSDGTDGVVEAIDNALTDWGMSPDAMRWSPETDVVDEHLPDPADWLPQFATTAGEAAAVLNLPRTAFAEVQSRFEAAVDAAFRREVAMYGLAWGLDVREPRPIITDVT